jgi:toxin ParE1/3/4
MARFRLADPAESDLATILSVSADRWGVGGRRRYAAVLAAAMRQVAAGPEGPLTRGRADLGRGLRSFHLMHARRAAEPALARPPHVLYYRVARDGMIEIVRVLHERMDPSRHLDALDEDPVGF